MELHVLPKPNHLEQLGGTRTLLPEDLRLKQNAALPPEGYRLAITQSEAVLEYATDAGAYYGKQTLQQLRQPDGTVPLVKIDDAPAFAWRGFMIDSSRHIQTVEEIKAFIEAAASFKCNVFHWHLCDDPGWRLESTRYPRLTSVGAWRDGWGFGNPNPERYGGYFTKAQIRDIIDFCAERFITVVPEFDIPGHSSAAIKAYPSLSCTGEDIDVTTNAGVFGNVLCPGKEETFDFCFGVLDEIIDLFPGSYIHIGGDEVPRDHWNACPACQARIKNEGLKNSDELQGYFTRRIADFLVAHGKTPIGWNEVLRVEHPTRSMVATKWWDPENACDAFANSGGKVIMEETSHVYLDYDYRRTPLRQTYSYDPLPDTLTETGKRNVLGVEAPIWTEWVETFDRMCYMCFPRLAAMAEVGWTQKSEKDYEDFKRRIRAKREPLLALGVKMAPESDWDPE
ncbi:MAG: beta-N-acetylhexosaminidase [Clostridia bacterium]|nr:beta-N-acetylhexosaminidase [Clostridia bacterium]